MRLEKVRHGKARVYGIGKNAPEDKKVQARIQKSEKPKVLDAGQGDLAVPPSEKEEA